MNLSTPCSVCISEMMKSGQSQAQISWVSATLQYEGVFGVTCQKGHKTTVAAHGAQHETLYFIAMNAFKDGYYREAVVSFASSMERFYEFFMRMTHHCTNKDKPEFEKEKKRFDANWKLMAKQSERQLGAYISCTEFMHGETAKTMSGTKVAFRNDVVHKGVIPTRVKTLNFGQEVCDVIIAGVELLYKKYGENIFDFINAYEELIPQMPEDLNATSSTEMVGIRIGDIIGGDNHFVRDVRKYLTLMFGDEVNVGK